MSLALTFTQSEKKVIREKCGIFGVFDSQSAARDIYMGLYAQQHRGQESAGIMVSHGPGSDRAHKGVGLVTQVFEPRDLAFLEGSFGIGHVRYSTSGSVAEKDVQPLSVIHRGEDIALAHNGNITNAATLKEELEAQGSLFTTTSDSEVMLHRIVRAEGDNPMEKMRAGLKGVEGAYSLVMKFADSIAAVRDPYGFRPLFLGRRGKSHYFASETCAFDILGAEVVAEIDPGAGVWISHQGMENFTLSQPGSRRMCSFEVIYFSRPDSQYQAESIQSFRVRMGQALFAEHPAEADIVTAVPDSSNSAALGYALASQIPFDFALIRNHYIGRTFIAPEQSQRDSGVRQKFNVVRDAVVDKRVIVVDDSLVRGTTSQKIIQLLRECGATEIHLRIASPMLSHPCYFGIDMPHREEFLVNRMPSEELAAHLQVDSIGFLSAERLEKILGSDICHACFTGNYPLAVPEEGDRISKTQ